MSTDALTLFRDTIKEIEALDFDTVKQQQIELGQWVRQLLADLGYNSVAAKGFEAPGVVVSCLLMSYPFLNVLHLELELI